jgi:hypothetical protein
MCFAVVPLAVRFFIAMQIRIGNGDFVLVKFFSAHEREVVYAFWALIVLGFGIIYVLAKDEVSRSLK